MESQIKKGYKKGALKEDGSEIGPPKHKVKDCFREVEIGGDGTGSRRSGGGGGGVVGGGSDMSFVSGSEIPEDDESGKTLLATGLSPGAVSGSFMAGVDSAPILPEGTLRTDGSAYADVTAGVSLQGTQAAVLSADGRTVQFLPVRAIGAGSKSFTSEQWSAENEGEDPEPESESTRAAVEAAGAQARAAQSALEIGEQEVGVGVAAIADRVFVRVVEASAGAAAGSSSVGAAIAEAAGAPVRVAVFDKTTRARVGTITLKNADSTPQLGGGFGLVTNGESLFIPTVQLMASGAANSAAGAAADEQEASRKGLGLPVLAAVDPFAPAMEGGTGAKTAVANVAHALARAQHLVIQEGITAHEALCRLTHLTDGRLVLAADRVLSSFAPPSDEDDEEEEPKMMDGYQVYGERVRMVEAAETAEASAASDGAQLVSCLAAKGKTEDYALPSFRPDALAFNAATSVIVGVDASNGAIGVMLNPATPRSTPAVAGMAPHGFKYVESAVGRSGKGSRDVDPSEFALQAIMALEERATSLARPLETQEYPARLAGAGEQAYSGAIGDAGVALQVSTKTMVAIVGAMERAIRRGDAVLVRMLIGLAHAHLQSAKSAGAKSVRAITLRPMRQGEADAGKPKLGADMLLSRTSCPQEWQKKTVWFSSMVSKKGSGKSKGSAGTKVPVKVQEWVT